VARVAVVTGAAKGIGAAIAGALAEAGCALALIDREDAGATSPTSPTSTTSPTR
jgi:NAD(P)-dependent dehydrogenase (short-subunit alcohol dehydrogenase family)